MRHLHMRKKMPLVAMVALLATVLASMAAGLMTASALAVPALGAGPSVGGGSAGTFARAGAPVGALAAAVVQSRELIHISGTVQGRGGTGKYAWTMLLSGAKVWVPTYAAAGVTTNALGAYALVADIPTNALYGYNEIRASRTSYELPSGVRAAGVLPVSADTQQVRNFVGTYALLVKGTTLKVTVLRAGKKVKGATVSCFGKSAKTNAAGKATLSKLRLKPGAKYKATVAKKGFHKATVSFTSRPGNSIGRSIAIHK